MKRVLIFSHALEIGGAERALLGLLHSFNYEKYRVDLFLMRHEGELMSYIPQQVNLLPEVTQYSCLAVPFIDVLKRGKPSIAAGRLIGKIKAKYSEKQKKLKKDNQVEIEYSHKYTCFAMPQLNDVQYDVAISFLTPHYFVAQKVNAKKKIAWIHTDYSCIDIDVESERKMWGTYDYIASISDACTDGFCGKFPELKNRIFRIDNICSRKMIREESQAFSVENEIPQTGDIRILSVGRFCTAKNFDNVPEICSLLLSKGISVKWYLIGYGGGEPLIRQKIEEYGMQNHVIILGKRSNPYPYIAACDLYVQPSRYEGNCVSVHEAQILNKPVVITNYPTAKNQLKDEIDGVIVPMDNQGCAEGIMRLLNDPTKMKQLQLNCEQWDGSNANEVCKIYKIVEE